MELVSEEGTNIECARSFSHLGYQARHLVAVELVGVVAINVVRHGGGSVLDFSLQEHYWKVVGKDGGLT